MTRTHAPLCSVLNGDQLDSGAYVRPGGALDCGWSKL